MNTERSFQGRMRVLNGLISDLQGDLATKRLGLVEEEVTVQLGNMQEAVLFLEQARGSLERASRYARMDTWPAPGDWVTQDDLKELRTQLLTEMRRLQVAHVAVQHDMEATE